MDKEALDLDGAMKYFNLSVYGDLLAREDPKRSRPMFRPAADSGFGNCCKGGAWKKGMGSGFCKIRRVFGQDKRDPAKYGSHRGRGKDNGDGTGEGDRVKPRTLSSF